MTPPSAESIGQGQSTATMKPASTAGVGKHYARYSAATVLIMLAGLISFPALTRLLDNTQYGILGYYDTWIMMIVAVIKLGAQHAILRLYPFGGDESRLTHFATNLVFLPMIISVGIWSIGIIAFGSISWWRGDTVSPVLWCAVLAIPLMVFNSQVEMTLRVSERSRLLTTTKIASRWLELAVVLGAVVLIQRSALSVYAGKLLCMLILAAFYARWVRRHLHFSRTSIDFAAYRDALHYSLPLVLHEIAGVALVSIGRVMLKHTLDDYAVVGIYTVGYALAMQLGVLVNVPLWDSFNPVANRVHTLEGPAMVRALKVKILLPATYACIGVAVAIWVIGSDALQMLSGPTKAASGPVFAWVGTMFAIMLLLDLSGYGLLLMKRSRTVLALMLTALAVNVGLNLLLIPAFGYMGAVYSAVASYTTLGVARCLLCPRELFQAPEGRALAIAIGAAVAFLLAMHFADLSVFPLPWMRVVVAAVLWLACYAVPVLVLDRRMWRLVKQWRAEMTSR
jgi:O-antigen/teichoic acid export membrane protein